MRARQPDQSGYAVNAGVRLYYEVHGSGPTTVVLLPTWTIIDSQCWKMQVPYLSRHHRVVTFDPRGNGRSDRPQGAAAHTPEVFADDLGAVLDATETGAAVLVGFCTGVKTALLFADAHPDRVRGMVAINTNAPAVEVLTERMSASFDAELDSYPGWAKENRHYWTTQYDRYLDFFFDNVAHEPHSTKIHDDLMEWGRQTDAETLICTVDADDPFDDVAFAEAVIGRLRCPVLAVTGSKDQIIPTERSRRFAELCNAELLVVDGAGHSPQTRYPVLVNHALRDFVDRIGPRAPQVRWTTALSRPRRALWISSPIGLGHVLRDIAIAREVRTRVPDLQIEWLAQPPVTDVLKTAGETIHPASDGLASESAHWEEESTGHDLHAFYAFRRMDEILLANFMVFDEVTSRTTYDLWVGDEAWDVDHYLHENPERKTAPYVFTTDVVGFLPVDPENDPREVELCTDYNAEMIEHRARYPRLRDASLFIGGYDELPEASLGTGLPSVRDWTRDWFDSVPYIVPFDPSAYRDKTALRRRLHHDPDTPLLVAAVGGTSVGTDLLGLVADGFARLRRRLPEARMLMVTGPRIDPRDIPDVAGMTKKGFVPDLFDHLAAADAAVVQGGLSTTMELVAARTPFVYFPLRNHWEQRLFVRHRLDHYRAGLAMEYAETTPDQLADAMLRSLHQEVRFREVRTDGAAQAAARIAPLLSR